MIPYINQKMMITQKYMMLILLISLSFGCSRVGMKIDSTTHPEFTIVLKEGVEMKFIWIPEAEVWFSSTEVTLAQMRCYSKTVTDYRYFRYQPGYTSEWPALNITASSSTKFAKWLNRKHGYLLFPFDYEFRLPTPQEWESVARCGDERKYPWGDSWPPNPFQDGYLPNLGGEDRFIISHNNPYDYLISSVFCGETDKNYLIEGYKDDFPGPSPVKMSGRNENGIFGMSGNVHEWCYDCDRKCYVLKGGGFSSIYPGSLEISATRILTESPSAFCAFLKDRPSFYGSGIRIVVGRPNTMK